MLPSCGLMDLGLISNKQRDEKEMNFKSEYQCSFSFDHNIFLLQRELLALWVGEKWDEQECRGQDFLQESFKA